ncbi:SNARE-binding exocyst subunit S6 [Tieghemiomyces parasiticus]|uniref:SNARE-binding exocyst subunit S6 n=1 Tax=Tieghemiomyces parasiticus TaxID=78921 RepID=A0A9W7ZNZ3_9FUNG|nr:SNARE-binding exocyst subunit S6 [Tieghemiomyces parasiticus]
MEEVRQHAVARLGELLKHPDDINFKVEVLRRKLLKEKRVLETQLNTDVQRQFDEIKDGLQWMSGSQGQVELVRRRVAQIDQLCQEAKLWIPHYERIAKISCTHRNFLATIDFVKEFRTFNEKRHQVAQLLDQAEAHIETLDLNLLRIHYELRQLEELRDRAMRYTAVGHPDVAHTLERMFGDIDSLSERFERILWGLAEYVFELAEQLRFDLIVQVCKVVEYEERRDQQGALLQQRGGQDAMKVVSPAAGSNWTRTDRHYKRTLLERLERAIRHRLATMLGPLSGADAAQTLEAMDEALAAFGQLTENVAQDLALVQNYVAPCFPPDFDILPFFVTHYHRAVYDHVQRLQDSPMDGGTILDLLRVSREYHVTIYETLGFPQEWLEPKLLEGKEEVLIQEYMAIVRKKLREWVDNLMTTETAEFVNRTKAPEVDADNLYCMQTSVIMFQIVNEQVELACESTRGRLIFDVVSECHAVFRIAQQQWKRHLDAECRRQATRAADVPPGLVDYVIALANDHLRAVEYTESVLSRACEVVNRSYQEKLHAELSLAMDEFMNLAKACCTALCGIVFDDVLPVFGQLFTPAWYKDDILQAVVLTLKDYSEDFRHHLHEYLFELVIKHILERFATLYLDAVANKGARFTRPASVTKFHADVEAAKTFFQTCLDAATVDAWLQPLHQTGALIESSATLIFLDFYAMKKQYPDLPLSFVKDILQKRDDVDRSQVKEIMETLNNKVKSEPSGMHKTQTVFSQLTNY